MDAQGIGECQLVDVPTITAGDSINTQRGEAIMIMNQFAHTGKGKSILSSRQLEWFKNSVMLDLSLPRQGSTNAPAGIRTDHILVLVLDGHHNSRPTPNQVFPTLGKVLPEDTKLLVVIVGYSQNSCVKKSIEAVAFRMNVVQAIYFAMTRMTLQGALTKLETGSNKPLKVGLHQVEVTEPSVIEGFGEPPHSKVRVHLSPGCSNIVFPCDAAGPPPGHTLIETVAFQMDMMQTIYPMMARTALQGPPPDHTLIIFKALYGLRTSGLRYHERFPDYRRDLGFAPCKAEPDNWIRWRNAI